MKRYILKEYGSWSVMTISYLAGFFAGGDINYKVIVSFIALSLFINSKQAFTMWSRRVDSKKSLIIFAAQVISASLIIIGISGELTLKLLPYALVPIAYILLLYLFGEHALITEICGFALLTLSSLIAKFVSTNMIDNILYIAVAVFFAASVFKVRLQLKRGLLERFFMAFYIVFALLVYCVIKVPIVVLLPLIDNAIFSITFYKIQLKATGWLEVIKGMAFLILIALFYS